MPPPLSQDLISPLYGFFMLYLTFFLEQSIIITNVTLTNPVKANRNFYFDCRFKYQQTSDDGSRFDIKFLMDSTTVYSTTTTAVIQHSRINSTQIGQAGKHVCTRKMMLFILNYLFIS